MTLARLSTSDGARLLHHLRYTYDAMGNVLTLQDYWNNNGSPQTQSFTYDALYRLASAQAIGGLFGNFTLESYSYNATSGNLESKAGVSYTYDANHPHAVASLSNGNTYQYDLNGNQTTRTIGGSAYMLGYDAENRLVSVSGPSLSAQFTYDGDGRRVASTINGVTTVFAGNHYEVTGGAVTKYYFAGGNRAAMRKNGMLYYLLSDHLGSTSLTTDSNGNKVAGLRYNAWGEVRYADGSTPTKYTYTGQYSYMGEFGLMFFNARWLDPALGRFAQADSIIPEASQGVQAWDRYAYVNNSPLNYIDPTGHDLEQIMFDKGEAIWHRHLRNQGKDRSAWAENPFRRIEMPNIFSNPQYPHTIIPPQSRLPECTPEVPCMSAWTPQPSWGTNSASPDYYALTITFGEGVVFEGVVIVDRYGQVFFGPSVGIGIGTPVSGSLTAGWIQANYNPNSPSGPNVPQSFLGGGYTNASIGFIGGGGVTLTGDGSNYYAPELGVFAPSATLSFGFTIPIQTTMKTFR